MADILLIAESSRAIAQLRNDVDVRWYYPGGIDRFVVSVPALVGAMTAPEWILSDDAAPIPESQIPSQDVELRRDPGDGMASAAWKLLHKIIVDRMRIGCTIILDVMSDGKKIDADAVRKLRGVLDEAEGWEYRVKWLAEDSSAGMPGDSENREKWSRIGVSPADVITVRQASDSAVVPVRDYDDDACSAYREIRVWGDVQGCGDAFTESVREVGDDPTVLKVFSGDLFDRGHGAAPVFDWMMAHIDDPTVLWVRGDHDGLLRIYGDSSRKDFMPGPTKDTIRQIMDGSTWVDKSVRQMLEEETGHRAFSPHEGGQTGSHPVHDARPSAKIVARKARDVVRRGARELYSRMVDVLPLKWDGRLWVVTHAGLHPGMLTVSMTGDGHSYDFDYGLRPSANDPQFPEFLALGWESQQFFYHGTGRACDKGDYDMDIDSLIDDVECQADECGMQTVNQIHGHRNKFDVGMDDHQHVWNLEHNVERGGTMRVAVIDRDGRVHVKEHLDAAAIKNPAPQHRSHRVGK